MILEGAVAQAATGCCTMSEQSSVAWARRLYSTTLPPSLDVMDNSRAPLRRLQNVEERIELRASDPHDGLIFGLRDICAARIKSQLDPDPSSRRNLDARQPRDGQILRARTATQPALCRARGDLRFEQSLDKALCVREDGIQSATVRTNDGRGRHLDKLALVPRYERVAFCSLLLFRRAAWPRRRESVADPPRPRPTANSNVVCDFGGMTRPNLYHKTPTKKHNVGVVLGRTRRPSSLLDK